MEKVLFLCVGNSCRSQIAEGLLNHYGKNKYIAFSAGSKPEKAVNSYSVNVMKELGIDISNNKPKPVGIYNQDYFDYVFTLCGQDDEICPLFLGKYGNIKFIPFPDPAKFEGTDKEIINFYRNIRDDIKEMILKYFKIG